MTSKARQSTLTSLALILALAASPLVASPALAAGQPASLPRYVIKDVGSFGGGDGLYSNPGSRALNSRGTNVGVDSTGLKDPFCPDWCFFDGYIDHAFAWKKGQTTDLGALAHKASSWALGLNDSDLPVGISETGGVDPVTGAPIVHGVRWREGKIQDLGVLGGTQSFAGAVNLQGQVAMSTETGTSDPYVNVPLANCLWIPSGLGTSCNQFDFGTNIFLLPVTSQTHAGVASDHQRLQDLGTIGGPDSVAIDINNAGQMVGWSYANFDAGVSGVPDTRPVLWENGTATDMGSLGGTFGAAMMINKNGQAIGVSNMAGDTVVHPFIWDKVSGHMQDLGSFGGWYAHPNWINDNGDVVGIASNPHDTRRAFYWHNDRLKNLGTIGTDARSVAVGINNNRLIVGYTFTKKGQEIRGFISDDGGALVDLNTLIDKPHGLNVLAAYYINDRNEIVGFALTQSGEIHPVVLIPETNLDQLAEADAVDGSGSKSAQAAPRVVHVKPIAICGGLRARLRVCASQ